MRLTIVPIAICLSIVSLASAENTRAAVDTPVASSNTLGLEEIVVTAQKREERLQNVPISMSVLGGKDLDRSTEEGIRDILNLVPGVATIAGFQGSGTQIEVRGVAAGSAVFSGSSPIAYYIDSVPFGLIKSAIAPDENAYDLERIEVLRGPQGTLYGASALNGVVRILTNDADLNHFDFKARASDSDTDGGGNNYRGDVAVNVPIIDGKLAVRGVIGYENDSGWIDAPNKKNINDTELSNYRLKINGQPTDELSFGLSAWRSRDHYGAPSTGNGSDFTTTLLDQAITTNFDAYGLKLGYAAPVFTLSSMTSYLDYENGGSLDLDPLIGTPALLFTGLRSHVFSEEAVLNSANTTSWRWSIGGIYRRATEDLVQPFYVLQPAPPPIDYLDTSKSYAVFGEVTKELLDGQLELTAGLRHFSDDIEQVDNPNSSDPNSVLVNAESKFSANSPRGVVAWHPSDQLTVYGSFSKGFRSGFPQNANATGFPPLSGDTLKNYEVGAKGSLLNGRVKYDTAVYYMDWQHVQQSLEVLFHDIPVAALVNGKSASGMGFDLSITTEPLDNLLLGANFSWNNLEMDGEVISGGLVLFEKGDRLNFSPEYTASASAKYGFPLGSSGFRGRIAASGNYTSEQQDRSLVGVPSIGVGDPMLTARASVGIEWPDKWSATLFADNITNESGSPIRTPFHIPDYDARIRPRTIGLQLDYHYR